MNGRRPDSPVSSTPVWTQPIMSGHDSEPPVSITPFQPPVIPGDEVESLFTKEGDKYQPRLVHIPQETDGPLIEPAVTHHGHDETDKPEPSKPKEMTMIQRTPSANEVVTDPNFVALAPHWRHIVLHQVDPMQQKAAFDALISCLQHDEVCVVKRKDNRPNSRILSITVTRENGRVFKGNHSLREFGSYFFKRLEGFTRSFVCGTCGESFAHRSNRDACQRKNHNKLGPKGFNAWEKKQTKSILSKSDITRGSTPTTSKAGPSNSNGLKFIPFSSPQQVVQVPDASNEPASSSVGQAVSVVSDVTFPRKPVDPEPLEEWQRYLRQSPTLSHSSRNSPSSPGPPDGPSGPHHSFPIGFATSQTDGYAQASSSTAPIGSSQGRSSDPGVMYGGYENDVAYHGDYSSTHPGISTAAYRATAYHHPRQIPEQLQLGLDGNYDYGEQQLIADELVLPRGSAFDRPFSPSFPSDYPFHGLVSLSMPPMDFVPSYPTHTDSSATSGQDWFQDNAIDL